MRDFRGWFIAIHDDNKIIVEIHQRQICFIFILGSGDF